MVEKWSSPGLIFLVTFAIVFCLSWLLSLTWWGGVIRAIVGIEQLTPPQVMAAETVRLDLKWNDNRSGLWDDLAVSKEQLITWARGVNSGKSLGENHWTPKPFSKTQYHQFRDKLISRELIRLHAMHYSSGYELTARGRATVRGLAEKYKDSATDSPSQGQRLIKLN
jgi:hypothetical protein